jgi:hypothetical protein
MLNNAITGVVKAVGLGEPRVFGSQDTQAIVWACDGGWCRFVPNEGHPVTWFDDNWHVSVGIELTPKGEAEFRQLS